MIKKLIRRLKNRFMRWCGMKYIRFFVSQGQLPEGDGIKFEYDMLDDKTKSMWCKFASDLLLCLSWDIKNRMEYCAEELLEKLDADDLEIFEAVSLYLFVQYEKYYEVDMRKKSDE